MRKKLSGIAAALAIATVAVLGATPANAATITFDYDLDGAEPTWTRVEGTAVPCIGPFGGGSYHYRTQTLTVDVDGAYIFWDTRLESTDLDDGFIAIYSAFDPASPASDCLAAFDDNGPSGLAITLTAGITYTVVQSTFGGLSVGSFRFSASGPGTVSVSGTFADTATSVTVSPNPVTVGDAVTLTATVTGESPTGVVEFLAGPLSLGTAPLIDGVATLPVAGFEAGSYEITAVYSGDENNAESATLEPVVLTVNPAAVTPTPPARVETAAA